MASTLASKWAGKVAQKQLVERGGKAGIKAASESLSKSSDAPSAPQVRSAVLESATLTDERLLTLAIVNMSRRVLDSFGTRV